MKRAVQLGVAAVTCIVAGGAAFAAAEHVSLVTGLYWAVITASTVGYGDVTPHGAAGHLVAVLVALTALPLLAVAYGELLSERVHIRGAIQAARHHLELMEQARKHHDELKALARKHHQEQLDRADVHAEAVRAHVNRAVSAVADAQVSAGSGSNPGSAGLAADERVVPPAATSRKPRTTVKGM